MNYTYLLLIACAFCLLPSCGKKETPPARENTKEDVKDALDTRENEMVKDVSEEMKDASEALKEAAEETADDIGELTEETKEAVKPE